jgi:lipopolysaccharide export system permease protein
METDPESPDSYPFVRVSFREWEKVFDLSEFQLYRTDQELFKSNRNMMTSRQLRMEADTIQLNIEKRKVSLSNFLVSYFPNLKYDTLEADRKPKEISGNKEKPAERGYQILRTSQTDLAEEAPTDSLAEPIILEEIKAAPVHKRRIWLSKAHTAARSIHNQTETAISSVDQMTEARVKVLYDMHMKYSMAVVCIIFLFIGAPMGAIIRKGGFGYPILVAIIFFMLFIILTIFCRKVAEAFIRPPWAAGWLPCAILLPVGMLLTRKAMNDSKLLGEGTIFIWIRKVLSRKKAGQAT